MAYRKHPPIPRYPTGPNCEGCPYRATSFGYAPVTSPHVRIGPDGSESAGDIRTPFLFLLEALGADEVEGGRNAIGPTGGVFNTLLHKNSPLRRSDQTLANVVRCRPVTWTTNADGEAVPMLNVRGTDHVNARPTPGQIRECASRYTDDLMARFKGQWVVGLGSVPLQYLAGRPMSVQTYRGSIMSPGQLEDCSACAATGKVPGRPIKCKPCKGRGHMKCECGGASKHRKRCPRAVFPTCSSCSGSTTQPGRPKSCPDCLGVGAVAADAETPLVSPKLSKGQHAFITYHPALLMRQPEMWSVVKRDFGRLADLDEELKVYAATEYEAYPPAPRQELCEAPLLSIDLETTGIDPRSGRILMIAATHETNYGAVFRPNELWLRHWMENEENTIVGQNFVLFDQKWLRLHGYNIGARVHDTRLFGKLLNPDTPNDIYYLAGEFAHPGMPGYWKTRADYRDNLERVAAVDVDAALRIYRGQRRALHARGQESLALDYVTPIAQIALGMQLKGIRVDDAELSRAYGTAAEPGVLVRDLAESRLELPDWGGTRSEGQHAMVQQWLYEHLKLPVVKSRGSGRPTADSGALQTLLDKLNLNHATVAHLSDEEQGEAVDFIHLVQSLRDKAKFLGYLKAYASNRSGWLHPELNPLGTGTLRWTSKEPNCQQVPACKCRPEKCYGTNPQCKGARNIFLPDGDDWEVMAVDLRQAEVIGMLWHAEAWDVLDKILHRGMDAHHAVASAILGRDPTKAERDSFKTTTFAILYGEMDKTTASRLGVPLDEVRRAREQYFAMLPGVLDARRGFIRQAMSAGFVESVFGVRRYIRVEREFGRAANQAANAPIQNIPPMVIGWRMLDLHRQLPSPARLWLQVHDEVDLVYPREIRKEVIECVKDIFRTPVKEMPSAPLGMATGLVFPVDIETGPSWGRVR